MSLLVQKPKKSISLSCHTQKHFSALHHLQPRAQRKSHAGGVRCISPGRIRDRAPFLSGEKGRRESLYICVSSFHRRVYYGPHGCLRILPAEVRGRPRVVLLRCHVPSALPAGAGAAADSPRRPDRDRGPGRTSLQRPGGCPARATRRSTATTPPAGPAATTPTEAAGAGDFLLRGSRRGPAFGRGHHVRVLAACLPATFDRRAVLRWRNDWGDHRLRRRRHRGVGRRPLSNFPWRFEVRPPLPIRHPSSPPCSSTPSHTLGWSDLRSGTPANFGGWFVSTAAAAPAAAAAAAATTAAAAAAAAAAAV